MIQTAQTGSGFDGPLIEWNRLPPSHLQAAKGQNRGT
jgi:hypothetical protein